MAPRSIKSRYSSERLRQTSTIGLARLQSRRLRADLKVETDRLGTRALVGGVRNGGLAPPRIWPRRGHVTPMNLALALEREIIRIP